MRKHQIKSFTVTISLLLLMSFGSSLNAQTDFTPDLSISFEDFKAQAVTPKKEIWVIDFWASWCRPCIGTIPELKALNEKYSGKGVRVVSLSWDENSTQWEAAVNKFLMDWNTILIPNPKRTQTFIDKHFPHDGIPALFIVGTDGKVKELDNVYKVDKQLEKMLAK